MENGGEKTDCNKVIMSSVICRKIPVVDQMQNQSYRGKDRENKAKAIEQINSLKFLTIEEKSKFITPRNPTNLYHDNSKKTSSINNVDGLLKT